jgi:hypothetical protein
VALFASGFAWWLWTTASKLPSSTFVQGKGVYRQLADPVRYGIFVVAVAVVVAILGTGIATFFGGTIGQPEGAAYPNANATAN